MTQAHIFYSGRVQGVGFRYTVYNFACNLGLVGWVRNSHDGRVEILVEGKNSIIEDLIDRIDDYFDAYIKDKNIIYAEPEGKFKGFEITGTI